MDCYNLHKKNKESLASLEYLIKSKINNFKQTNFHEKTVNVLETKFKEHFNITNPLKNT